MTCNLSMFQVFQYDGMPNVFRIFVSNHHQTTHKSSYISCITYTIYPNSLFLYLALSVYRNRLWLIHHWRQHKGEPDKIQKYWDICEDFLNMENKRLPPYPPIKKYISMELLSQLWRYVLCYSCFNSFPLYDKFYHISVSSLSQLRKHINITFFNKRIKIYGKKKYTLLIIIKWV